MIRQAPRSPGTGGAQGRGPTETRLQFLDQAELERLLAAAHPEDAFGRIEPTVYLPAAMTGPRHGEFLAHERDLVFCHVLRFRAAGAIDLLAIDLLAVGRGEVGWTGEEGGRWE